MSDNFEIRSPATKEEWKRYDDFRWEVLRKPLKMSHIPLKDDLEDKSVHLMGVTSKGRSCCLWKASFKYLLRSTN